MTSSYSIKAGMRPDSSATPPGPGGAHTGFYRQDNEYIVESGTLDENNGRFATTPEYPNGIYHYHVTPGSFPYVFNSFKGVPNFQTSLLPFNALGNLTSSVVRDVYEIPAGGKYLVEVGDPVDKFNILLSGISFYDYLIDPDKITSILTASGTTQQYDVTVIPDFDGNLGFNLGSLSEDIV